MSLMDISVNNGNVMVQGINGTNLVHTQAIRLLRIRHINSQAMIVKRGKRQLNTLLYHINRITLLFSVKAVNDTVLHNHTANRV